MKKIAIAVLITIFTLSLAGCGLFGGAETTTTEDPANTTTVNYDEFIEIQTIAELQEIEMNKSYKLMNNLDLTDIEWIPLGTNSDPYKGYFDGNGYAISSLNITQDNLYNGLFGYVEGNIFDLTIENANISFDSDFATYAGLIAGYSNGNITGCDVEGTITIENDNYGSYIGMLVGFTQGKIDETTIITEFEPNLINQNTVTGQITITEGELGFIGGLAGKTFNTTVSNNFSSTSLDITTGNYQVYIGGLIGHNFGGIYKGYEAYVDDVNIYIENNISQNLIEVTVNNADVSIGGMIGYNLKGYHRDNYVESNILVDEVEVAITNEYMIKVGGYFGEGWESQVEDIIINTTTNAIFVPDNTQNYAVNALSGKNHLEFTPSNVYIVIPSNFNTEDFLTGTAAELLISSFYTTTLGWATDFLDDLN